MTNATDQPIVEAVGARNFVDLGLGDGTTFENAPATRTALGAAGNPLTAPFDCAVQIVHSNLVSVVTSVSGTLTTAAHLGRMVVTSGNITVPTTTGFHCYVKAGGAHTITFNSTVTAAAATGQVCSVLVQSATVVAITPWTTLQTLS